MLPPNFGVKLLSIKGRYKISSYATIIYFSALPDRGEDGIDIKDEFSELPFPSQVSITSNDMSIGINQNNLLSSCKT